MRYATRGNQDGVNHRKGLPVFEVSIVRVQFRPTCYNFVSPVTTLSHLLQFCLTCYNFVPPVTISSHLLQLRPTCFKYCTCFIHVDISSLICVTGVPSVRYFCFLGNSSKQFLCRNCRSISCQCASSQKNQPSRFLKEKKRRRRNLWSNANHCVIGVGTSFHCRHPVVFSIEKNQFEIVSLLRFFFKIFYFTKMTDCFLGPFNFNHPMGLSKSVGHTFGDLSTPFDPANRSFSVICLVSVEFTWSQNAVRMTK